MCCTMLDELMIDTQTRGSLSRRSATRVPSRRWPAVRDLRLTTGLGIATCGAQLLLLYGHAVVLSRLSFVAVICRCRAYSLVV